MERQYDLTEISAFVNRPRGTWQATSDDGIVLVGLLALWAGCSREGPSVRIGVAFETLQTEYWVASFEAVRAELDRRGIEMIEAVAENDANRQVEQIHTFIARGVDGILVAPKDATTVVPMIRAANEAGIPIVIYNRPPARSRFVSTTVVADNYELAKATVRYMAEQASCAGGRHRAMVLIGDLGDINAVGRRDGFLGAASRSLGRRLLFQFRRHFPLPAILFPELLQHLRQPFDDGRMLTIKVRGLTRILLQIVQLSRRCVRLELPVAGVVAGCAAGFPRWCPGVIGDGRKPGRAVTRDQLPLAFADGHSKDAGRTSADGAPACGRARQESPAER